MPTLTKEQQEQKNIEKANNKRRLVVKSICNRLTMQFSFGNIKNQEDLYKYTGYDAEYISSHYTPKERVTPVTLPDIKSWCSKIQADLEETIRNETTTTTSTITPPKPSPTTPVEKEALAGKQESIQEKPLESEHDVSRNGDKPQPTETISKLDETGYTNDNDYGLPTSPKESAYLYYFQKKAAKESLDKILGFDIGRYPTIAELKEAYHNTSIHKEPKPAILIIASTGTGKTFIDAAIDRRLLDIEFDKDKTFGHSPNIHVTRATVVEQTKRVLKNFFSIEHPADCEVINIEQLRSRAGEIWILNKSIIVNGEEQEVWEWKPYINPSRLRLDECQAVKNEDSTQHKILIAYSAIKSPTTQVFISATPFTRVSEAKAFAIATHKDISKLGFPAGTKLSATNWQSYAAAIASPSLPDEYNEAAVERLMKDLDDYIVRVKGVRWQFNAINKVEIIDFDSPSEKNDFFDAAKEYADAWNRYLIKKAKLEESVTDNPRFQALVELGIFLAAAEYCKRYVFAERMYHDVRNGFAAVLGIRFKKTIIAVTKILIEKYGAKRSDISLVWGGGATQLTAKQKLKNRVLEHSKAFEEAGISMEDLALEDVETRVLEDLPAELRLGNQSKEQRQSEIDRFQSGKSLYCMFTEAAGGVGLSLHHTDEQSPVKVRRQKNGYAVVEDIHLVPVRPRKTTIGPTWSPIGMVQKIGRVPRLTSLSDTEQSFLYYRGTVEEEQAFVVTHRLKCLKQVVKQRENWQDLIENYKNAKEIAKGMVDKNIRDDNEDDVAPDEGED